MLRCAGAARVSQFRNSRGGTRCHDRKFTSNASQASNVDLRNPRRVLMYVPGSDQKKIQKAKNLDLDCVVLDLEDGVAVNQKAAARALVSQTLLSESFGRSEKMVRINAIGSGDEFADLESLHDSVEQLSAILLPKVEEPFQLQFVSHWLDKRCGQRAKHIKYLATVESAKGLVNLRDICRADPRLDALILGAEDFCANMTMTRTSTTPELLYARSAIATHAVAHSLHAIDMVCVQFQNLEQLKREAEEGARMGFTGKQVIHPNQIATVYAAFKPPASVADFARRILEGNEKHQAEGKGAFSLDGKMIDMPMVKWAQRILNRSQ